MEHEVADELKNRSPMLKNTRRYKHEGDGSRNGSQARGQAPRRGDIFNDECGPCSRPGPGTFALEARADSSTAHEMLVHLEVVLAEIVDRGLPRLHDEDQNRRRIYDGAGWDAVDLVQLCVERLREPAVRDPETTRHLLQMLRRVGEVAKNREATAVVDEIEQQVEKVLSLAKKDRMLSRNCE